MCDTLVLQWEFLWCSLNVYEEILTCFLHIPDTISVGIHKYTGFNSPVWGIGQQYLYDCKSYQLCMYLYTSVEGYFFKTENNNLCLWLHTST